MREVFVMSLSGSPVTLPIWIVGELQLSRREPSMLNVSESLAQVLCRYIKGRKGHLFTTRAGCLLDSRNVLDVLQQAGRQGGYHAFRRFRFAVLRKAGVPDDLIKQWLGHSQNLIDLYSAQLRYDESYRREWCEKAGLGFELGELGYKRMAPIRPLLVA